MSKIGNYNLELEEELRDQLSEKGFSTIQDMVNAGYGLSECGRLVKIDHTNEAYKEEQKEFEKEKARLLEQLDCLLKGYPYSLQDAEIIVDTIEFIKKCKGDV